MPKRKRSLEDELVERLVKCRKDLFRVLKVAKGFERQRLAKRIRDEKSTPEKVARLEREVIVLKSLDLQQAANAHLCSTLLKIKAVAESPNLPDDLRTGVSKPDISEEERTALHNVSSALYNRSQVREVLDRAVADICAILRVPAPDKKGKGKKGEKKASVEKPIEDTKAAEKAIPRQQEQREGSWSGEEDDFAGFDDEDEAGDEEDEKNDEESGSDGQEPLDDEESGDISSGKEEEAIGRWEAMLGSGSSDENEEDDEEEEDGDDKSAASDDASVSASPPRKVARAKASKDAKPLGADSLFLPSLMGGYISGSESASDVDVAPPARKNRRGQRARQALSELKYKDKAKHLEKAKKGRDAGWDSKRGAVGGDGPWKKGYNNPFERTTNNGGNPNFERPQRAAPPPKKDNEGPLHPSWEARKKAKEMQKSATFQGKKVTFD